MTHIDTSLLHAYLDGDLTSSQKANVEAHLPVCDICRAELSALKNLKTALLQIASPDPGPEYFRRSLQRIAARTDKRVISEQLQRSNRIGPVPRGQYILRVMIRLAAVITLLFASFYASQLVGQNRAGKWAKSAAEDGLAQDPPAATETEMMEMSAGMNRIGPPPQTEDNPEPIDDK